MTRSRFAILSLSLLAACGGEPADEPLGIRQDELLVPTAAVAMGEPLPRWRGRVVPLIRSTIRPRRRRLKG